MTQICAECYISPSIDISSGRPAIQELPYPKISVVIVSYNRPKPVKRTVDSLMAQSVRPYEIIVIDDGSKPRLDLKTTFENFQLIHFRTERGLSNSRNFGVNIATGEYVAFIDDDAEASPNWLEEVEKEILKGADILGGPLIPNFEAAPPEWWNEKDFGGLAGIGNAASKAIWGANMIFSKKVFDYIGLFDPRVGRQKGKLMSHEERELITKAKSVFKVAFVPAAVVSHSVPARRLGLKYILQWRYYDGVSDRKLANLSIRQACGIVRSLLRATVLFLRSSMKRDKKTGIQHLTSIAYYIGRIL